MGPLKCEYCGFIYEPDKEFVKYIKYRKKYKMFLCDECIDKANGQWLPNSGLDTYPDQIIFLNKRD